MAFTRPALKDLGLTAEQVDSVMALHGQSLSGFISTADAETAKQTAIADALKNAPKADPKESEEYKTLSAAFETYKTKQSALAGDDFKGVKEKFRDTVYDMLSHEKTAKPVKEQLDEIKGKYEEYFLPDTSAEQKTAGPTFGAKTEGSMPTGYKEGSFAEAWGFVPKEK